MDMSALSAALASLDVPTLTNLCEDSELTAAASESPHPQPTLHLLSLLLQNDLSEARFLWRRLPASLKSQPLTAAAWSLGRAIWTRNWAVFYQIARSNDWHDAKPLVDALLEMTKKRTTDATARAFVNVKAERVGEWTGCDYEGVKGICKEQGWDMDGGFVKIERKEQEGRERKEFERLEVLTGQLVRLQTTS